MLGQPCNLIFATLDRNGKPQSPASIIASWASDLDVSEDATELYLTRGCAALFCSFDFHGVFYVVKRAQWLLWRGPHSPQSKAPDNSLKGRMSGAFVVLRLILVLIFGFIDRETSEVKGFGVRLSANLKVGHQLLDFGILMLWVFRSG